MKRNPIINVDIKTQSRYLNADNFSIKKNNTLLISSRNINEKIHLIIKKKSFKI